MTIKIACFDVDGTLVDIEHRLHFVKTKPKNWPAFEKAMIFDSPLQDIIDLNNVLYEQCECTYIITARNEIQRDLTIEELSKFGVKYDILLMRKRDDHRKDFEIKLDHLKNLIAKGHKPDLWFEDRDQVVGPLREAGIRVLQVCNGSY